MRVFASHRLSLSSDCFHNLVFPARGGRDRVPEVRTGGSGFGRRTWGRGHGGWNGPKKADTTAGTGPPAVTKVILRRVPQNTGTTLEIHVGILYRYWLYVFFHSERLLLLIYMNQYSCNGKSTSFKIWTFGHSRVLVVVVTDLLINSPICWRKWHIWSLKGSNHLIFSYISFGNFQHIQMCKILRDTVIISGVLLFAALEDKLHLQALLCVESGPTSTYNFAPLTSPIHSSQLWPFSSTICTSAQLIRLNLHFNMSKLSLIILAYSPFTQPNSNSNCTIWV